MRSDYQEVIPWVVSATLNALQAASEQSDVKRVVLTSSSAAAFISQPDVEGVRIDTGSSATINQLQRAVMLTINPRHLE